MTKVVLDFTIDEGYHIQLNNTQEENLIASEVIIDQQVIEITFLGEKESIALGKSKIDVFSNDLRIVIEMKTDAYLSAGSVSGYLYYQACDNFKCYFPRKLAF